MRKSIVLVVFGAAALMALAGAGLWWFQKKSVPVFFARDAVQVIAYEASDMFGRNPGTTHDEIARMITSLHEASVINLKVDSRGRAVDPFGEAFRVENRIEAGNSTTTVVSAGADREFGTRDDVVFTHEEEMESERDEYPDGG